MSRGNVEIVREFLEALFDRRDFDDALRFTDPDLELDWTESRAPYAGVTRGARAAKEIWELIAESWRDVKVERDLTDCGQGVVVAEQSILGQGRSSGVEVRATGATIWKLRDGKIVSGKLFQSKAEAIEAVGKPE
ncbi:MAG: nuclear transport factor 2 family protein [Solirubrobacterales bacterium]|nr:nuclear transport factor 2 family protein [Solirubrobacterales bacterium]